jgi:hypothetical protein
MLTIEERKQLQYNLIMDDIKPHKVMSLTDEELIRINKANDEYNQRCLAEAMADNNPNRNKGVR